MTESDPYPDGPTDRVRGCAVQATCGGCPQLSLGRPQELSAKVAAVQTALLAVGIDTPVTFPARRDSLGRFGYRNRLRMKVIDGRADFFNQAKRDGCPVVRPDLWAAIEKLRTTTAEEPSLLAGVDHLEVRVGDATVETGGTHQPVVGLALYSHVDLVVLRKVLGDSWAVTDPTLATPPSLPYLASERPDIWVDVPVTAFVQVNSAVNRQLVAEVLGVANRTKAATFLDLFCGAGNFSVPLVASGRIGTAVERSGDAIEALSRVDRPRGSMRCIEGDARSLLPDLEPADLVIADPPRAGLQSGYHELARLVGDTLVLIGCNVSSFANDVAAMGSAGLQLESVKVFDMFPGTNHVETLAVLRSSSC